MLGTSAPKPHVTAASTLPARPLGSLLAAVRRARLAPAMAVLTTLLAVATGALSGGTPPSVVARFGFSLDRLRAGRLYVLPVSDWLVYDARHWGSMLLLFAAFAAPLEAVGGPGLLAATFAVGSWGGTLLAALAVRFLGGPLGWHPRPDLVGQPDIGGSVGAWAAAGALNVLVDGRWPWLVWPARMGAGIYLGDQLAAVHGAADVAHPLGFLFGALVATVLRHRHGRRGLRFGR